MAGHAAVEALMRALGNASGFDQVAAWLDGALESGRARWPGVELDETELVDHLAQLPTAPASLAELRASDLYLAAACAKGSPSAISAFEAAHGGDMVDVIRRTSKAVDAHEIMQSLRELLFVGYRGAAPKLRSYGGRGELRAWLRVIATRAAINGSVRGPKERVPLEDDEGLLDAAGAAENPEILYFRLHYEGEVKKALPDALAALTPQERLLLRQHYIDQLTLDELAKSRAVHVATLKRHLAGAKSALNEHLRARLTERLNLSPSELRSVLAIVQSRLHVTMSRLLVDDSRE